MKLAIVGSVLGITEKKFRDIIAIFPHNITEIIVHENTKIHKFCLLISENTDMSVTPVPLEWDIYEQGAHTMRNVSIVENHNPDCVIIFPSGKTTTDMIKKCTAAGIKHYVIDKKKK